MEPPILVLNAGSSSLKFAVFDSAPPGVRKLSGSVERIGTASSPFKIEKPAGEIVDQGEFGCPAHVNAVEAVLEQINRHFVKHFSAIGHRVVHGGAKYRQPHLVTMEMMAELRQIQSFDREHLPAEIAVIELLAKKWDHIPQVACFDTAFHSHMPRVAQLIPIPRRYQDKGVHRYGFHGLSYEYLLQELERRCGRDGARGRMILAHLGNGASMTAVQDGKCVDTTMAFTPAAGLVMSTRAGDIDPGVATFLMKEERLSPAEIDKLMNHESGLLAISETSSDMRDLLRIQRDDPRAAEAVELFCYQARKFVGAYSAVLGGLDTLVFAGGIGEHAAPVRERICRGLGFLGIIIDGAENDRNADVISTSSSRVIVRVMRTDEELMIARSVRRVLNIGVP